jgi:hypothetical protein
MGAEVWWTIVPAHTAAWCSRTINQRPGLIRMICRGSNSRWLRALALAGGLLLSATPALGQRGSILNDVPAQPRPGARYLIYLHGRIVEEKGSCPTAERFGTYEYQHRPRPEWLTPLLRWWGNDGNPAGPDR